MSIRFLADSHEYFNDNDEKYLSVSGVAHLLEPKKNWVEIAKKRSRKLKREEGILISPEELLEEWDRKKNLGTQAGTIIHDIEEKGLIDQVNPILYGEACKIVTCGYSGKYKVSLKSQKLENNTVYPELIIYNHHYKITGQSDKVIVVNNTLNVEDYKTDEELVSQAFSNEWVGPEKLLPPVSHLDNCNLNLYAIKMSMYMYLLWLDNKNLKVGNIILEHLQLERDQDGIAVLKDGKPTILKRERRKVPYLRKEVRDIFEWYKAGKL